MSLWHFNKCGRIWEKICFRSNWVVSLKFPVTLIPSELTFTCSKLIIENARKRCEICSKVTIKKNTRTTFLNFEKLANRQILKRESKIIVPTFCCCYGYGCSVKLINSHTFSFFFLYRAVPCLLVSLLLFRIYIYLTTYLPSVMIALPCFYFVIFFINDSLFMSIMIQVRFPSFLLLFFLVNHPNTSSLSACYVLLFSLALVIFFFICIYLNYVFIC